MRIMPGGAVGPFNLVETGSMEPISGDHPLPAMSIGRSTTFSGDFEPVKDATKLLDCDASAAPDGSDSFAGGEV